MDKNMQHADYFNLLIIQFFFTVCRNEEQSSYGNIMYDRRVVRGNTYAQHILPLVSISTDKLENCLISRMELCVFV